MRRCERGIAPSTADDGREVVTSGQQIASAIAVALSHGVDRRALRKPR